MNAIGGDVQVYIQKKLIIIAYSNGKWYQDDRGLYRFFFFDKFDVNFIEKRVGGEKGKGRVYLGKKTEEIFN